MLIIYSCKRNRITYSGSFSQTILASGDNMLLICGLFIGFLLILMNLCNRFKIVNILNMFTNFDREVSSLTFVSCFPFHCSNSISCWIQMTSYEIYFDYKKECIIYYLYCAFSGFAVVFMTLITLPNHSTFYRESTVSSYLLFFISNDFVNSQMMAIMLLYIVLLHSLHKRLVILNIFLRFDSFSKSENFQRNDHNFYQYLYETENVSSVKVHEFDLWVLLFLKKRLSISSDLLDVSIFF